ncbi:hypothetical protein RNZ50_21160 [Paracoccaceae bacterium Fryx2]|nr:hypothetical protein [Paracoccaceae bacterium Fryx2]
MIHLQPNEVVPQRLVPPQAVLTVGKESPGVPALNLTIAPPFGQEIAVAFATSAPLFDTPRPMVEPAEPYLAALRAEVARQRAATPDFKGEWVYFFISTVAE